MNPAAVGLATLLVGTTVVLLAIWAGRAAPSADTAVVSAKVYRGRCYYTIAALIVMAIAALRTLSPDLYAAPPGEVVVNVQGQMWSWRIESPQTPLPVGKRVEFRVTSADVNHGFGIYDEAGNLLVQTQAMPKYENRVSYTFEKPGRYLVACMEFCGVVHHMMTSTLEVR